MPDFWNINSTMSNSTSFVFLQGKPPAGKPGTLKGISSWDLEECFALYLRCGHPLPVTVGNEGLSFGIPETKNV